MAIKTELIIVVEKDGTVTITTQGIKGAECEEEVKPFEKALGKVVKREKTSEYYEKSNVKTTVTSKRK